MGVDAKYYLMVGVKGCNTWVKSYKSKNDSDYIFDLEQGDIEDYMNVLFEDYFPPNFKCLTDNMCGEYSIIGKVLQKSEYIDEIYTLEITPDLLDQLINEVHNELKSLGIEVNKKEVKLHSFVYYS